MEPLMLTTSRPISLNNAYANDPRGGRYTTKAAANWKTCEGWNIAHQLAQAGLHRRPLFTGGISVSIDIERIALKKGGWKREDIDGKAKLLLDVLTDLRVWNDDSQVSELHMRWAPVSGCRVTISELAE